MKLISKSIQINASKEKVWSVITEDQYTRQWFSAFSEGVRAEVADDWKIGSKVVYLDASNEGMLARVAAFEPGKTLRVEFRGTVSADGVEDETSEDAKAMQGFFEDYQLTEGDGGTRLDVKSDMDDAYYDSMQLKWDTGMQMIKKLAEA